MPKLNRIRHRVGNIRSKKPQKNVIPSAMQKMRKTTNVSPKLIRDVTSRENRNKYFGTLTLENTSEFDIIELILPPVASLKKEKTNWPENI